MMARDLFRFTHDGCMDPAMRCDDSDSLFDHSIAYDRSIYRNLQKNAGELAFECI